MKVIDKTRAESIWDRCPQCAYKHITAAYAALTSNPVAGGRCVNSAAPCVAAARAMIAAGEVDAGYAGNVDLVTGCLALAENEGTDADTVQRLREERLRIVGGAACDALRICSAADLGPDDLAAAHLVEAARELPELLDNDFLYDRFDYDGGFVVSAVDFAEVLSAIANVAKYLRETYEFAKTKGVEDDV